MNSETSPLVSICIPTYNGEAYIEACLNSALAQTYTNIEIVVSDDDSTDNTLEIIRAIQADTDIPIKIYHHQPTVIGANWNNSVKHSEGQYIKFLFQDDLLQPGCVSEMMAMIGNCPNAGLVYCRRELIFEKETPEIRSFVEQYGDLHIHWDELQIEKGCLSGRRYLGDKALLNSPKNKIGEPVTTLIKRECFDIMGLFSEELKQTLDYEYWYRLMRKYDVAFIDKQLVKFRLHEAQASVINKDINKEEGEKVYYAYYKNIFRHLHPSNKMKLLKRFHPVVKFFVKLKNS